MRTVASGLFRRNSQVDACEFVRYSLGPMSDSGGHMDADPKLDRAYRLLEKAYERQRAGDFDAAVRLYKASIDERPTAEAHTYLGWTLSNMGKFDDAIEQCKTAILVDPGFGNP